MQNASIFTRWFRTAALKAFFIEVLDVFWRLVRVMVPALLIVKALEEFGAIRWLAWLLSPIMALVGLPSEMGIVWASTLLTNIYTGLAVFFSLAAQVPMTAAQATVLGTLMLVAHSLPVEAAVAKAAGVSWRATLMLRIGGALGLGTLLHWFYARSGWLDRPLQLAWQAPAAAPDLAGWVVEQGLTLLWIFAVIAALMALLNLLRWLHVERLVHLALAPLLRLIGIRGSSASITVIGVTLGLTIGAGLLLKEVHSGIHSRRDVFLTMGFLGLCHSLIEDTLLIMLIGADLSAILWARLLFALLLIGTLARLPALNRRLDANTTTPETAKFPI